MVFHFWTYKNDDGTTERYGKTWWDASLISYSLRTGKMTMEIVDLAMNSMVINHSYLSFYPGLLECRNHSLASDAKNPKFFLNHLGTFRIPGTARDTWTEKSNHRIVQNSRRCHVFFVDLACFFYLGKTNWLVDELCWWLEKTKNGGKLKMNQLLQRLMRSGKLHGTIAPNLRTMNHESPSDHRFGGSFW
jgi:hypothetical protein